MPLSTEALEVSGILRIQNQPLLDLTGRGVLIGFLDSGIDYTHPAFLDSRGQSRILRIWDQSIRSESYPLSFPYGTEYSQEELNRALASTDPFSLVPTRDEPGMEPRLQVLQPGLRIPRKSSPARLRAPVFSL